MFGEVVWNILGIVSTLVTVGLVVWAIRTRRSAQ